MHFTFVLSAGAFLANLAVILFLYRLRAGATFARPMLWLYVCLAGFNLGVALMISAPGPERAHFFLLLMRPFLFFLFPCFLWTTLALTGRGGRFWLWPAFALACAMSAAAAWSFFSGSRFFIREMQALPYGYLPRAGPGAAIGLSGLFLLTVPGAFFLLGRAALRAAPLADTIVSPRRVFALFVLWWAGLSSNGLVLAGVNVFPMASLVDAVMSFVLTAYLHRHAPLDGSARGLLRLAGMLASLCPGALVSYIFLEFVLPGAPAANGLIGLITAAVTLAAFYRWFERSPSPHAPGEHEARRDAGAISAATRGPLFVRLQREYALTYQEALICEQLARGLPRAEIVRRLGVRDGTFRNHLSEIYRKTVDTFEIPAAGSRDKWQRLTVFLHRVEETRSKIETHDVRQGSDPASMT